MTASFRFALWTAMFLVTLGCEPVLEVESPDDTSQADTSQADTSRRTSSDNSGFGLLAPVAEQPQFQLSNLRFHSRPTASRQKFSIDWKLTSGQNHNYDVRLVVDSKEGDPLEMAVNAGINADSGVIDGGVTRFGITPPGEQPETIADKSEFYLVHWVGGKRFKLSNSITVGSASTTSTRKANAAEIEAFANAQKEGIAQGAEYAERVAKIAAARQAFEEEQNAASQPSQTNASSSTQPSASSPNPSPSFGKHPTMRKSLPTDSGLGAVPAGVSIPAQTPLYAEWAGKWLPVIALKDSSSGSIYIGWEGYASNWDENKSRSELRIESSVLQQISR